MTKGKFIVFEGGEGSGKTSAISIALETVKASGQNIIKTREPGGTPGAEAIRSILIVDGADYDPKTNVMLFAAARRDHVTKVIKPALERGDWVISDRYVLSTLSYQGAGEGVPVDYIKNLHDISADGLLPDLTIVLDIDPVIGIERSNKRLAQQNSNENRFEGYKLDFHQRLRQQNLDYDWSDKIVIDASRSLEDVHEEIRGAIENFIAVQS